MDLRPFHAIGTLTRGFAGEGAGWAVGRQFLFLQGPHGPFFAQLATALKARGAEVMRVTFNSGDRREWGRAGPVQPYAGPLDSWETRAAELMEERGVTDLVVYGDTRPVHAAAIRAARARGATVHCFEEGYLRPHWITYERNGANGNSRLMDFTVEEMARASRISEMHLAEAPAHWGSAWLHALHGFRYHFDILFRNRAYRHHRPHRPTSVGYETFLYLRRLVSLPFVIPQRRVRERRLLGSGEIYTLALLQMAVDSSMRDHSRFTSVGEFIDEVIAAFAAAAPRDHRLIFKAHPFEDGRERLERAMRRSAEARGVADRVGFLHGGRLGPLLDRARSVVTINSTAAQQALWRGLPTALLGRSVIDKPEFLRGQSLEAFFRHPKRPDALAYREFRQFLLLTSQLQGGFYSRAGRKGAIGAVLGRMLDPLDPYDRLFAEAGMAGERDAAFANVAFFPRGGRSARSALCAEPSVG